MYIESLKLNNFRNYEDLSVAFAPGINVFYGDNAQGKTNLLEALYLCATSKSHRRSRDGEIIRFGQEEAHIRMMLDKKGAKRRIDMHLRKSKAKGVAIDGVPIRKAAELLGLAGMVVFSPEDLSIIKRGPKERRRFLDALISQLDPYYLHALTAYQKILAQRNRLLKDLSFNRSLESTLDVWDEQMVRYGEILIQKRAETVQSLQEIAQEVHGDLTEHSESLRLEYEPDVQAGDFLDTLGACRERDKKFRLTTSGPHRDDLRVATEEIDIRQFGSQGQQRSAALTLKLSEIRMIESHSGEKPVLLLDDVLSELDEHRQNALLNIIGDGQTFITCTGMDDLVEHKFPVDLAFHIDGGAVLTAKA